MDRHNAGPGLVLPIIYVHAPSLAFGERINRLHHTPSVLSAKWKTVLIWVFHFSSPLIFTPEHLILSDRSLLRVSCTDHVNFPFMLTSNPRTVLQQIKYQHFEKMATI